MRKSHVIAPLLLGMLYSCRSAPQVITIDSSPSNAVVKIDNQVIGNTPLVYTLPKDKSRAKTLVIRAEKSGYEEQGKLLSKKGKKFESTVYLTLQRLPQQQQTQFVGVPQAAPTQGLQLQINTGQQNANTNIVPTGPVITGPNNNNAGSANNSSNGGGNGSGNGGNR